MVVSFIDDGGTLEETTSVDSATVQPAPPTVTTFISNTGKTSESTGAITTNFGWNAQQFTTGSHLAGYSLSEIVVKIQSSLGGAVPAFALHQSTTNGTVDVPGTKIVDLSGSVGTAGDQSFTPDSTTTLSASTKYFVLFATQATAARTMLEQTLSNDHDSDASAGWEIADSLVLYP